MLPWKPRHAAKRAPLAQQAHATPPGPARRCQAVQPSAPNNPAPLPELAGATAESIMSFPSKAGVACQIGVARTHDPQTSGQPVYSLPERIKVLCFFLARKKNSSFLKKEPKKFCY
jgi:hypothetical protein